MFNFTPLLGAQSASPASQSLLEFDGGVKVLIDVGWDESFNAEKLKEIEKYVGTSGWSYGASRHSQGGDGLRSLDIRRTTRLHRANEIMKHADSNVPDTCLPSPSSSSPTRPRRISGPTSIAANTSLSLRAYPFTRQRLSYLSVALFSKTYMRLHHLPARSFRLTRSTTRPTPFLPWTMETTPTFSCRRRRLRRLPTSSVSSTLSNTRNRTSPYPHPILLPSTASPSQRIAPDTR
jgi:hypothetical protein